jgi:hypothetical protein
MNGGIDERQLLEMQFQTLKIVEPLISNEIGLMYQKNNEGEGKSKALSKSDSSEEIKRDVDKTVTEILKQKSAKPDEAPKPETTD